MALLSALRPHRRPWSRGRVAVGLLALLAGALPTVSADAATPTSGSVSDTAPTYTWSAGPFAVPNVTGTAGTVTCGSPQLCDDHALKVSVPAGYDAGHSLRIDVKWPDSAADFDLYVLGPDGREVAASASSSDPETVLLPAVSASYTVRVVPFAPLGDSFTADARLVTNPAAPPPSTATPPTYGNSSAPGSIKDAHNAGEPSIGVNRASGAAMFQSYTSTLKVTYDSAGTATWQDKSATAAKGCPQGSTTSLDPILFTDPDTHRTFESQLAGKTALTCYTDDDGETWTPTGGSGINSGVDHQTIGGGHFAPGGPGAVTSYPNAVYYCSQDIADASCAVSRDGGLTYGPAVPMYSLLDCGGLHGHVKVAPDGTVYVPNKGCGGNQAVAVSEDNGLTWNVRPNPSSTPGDSDPSVGVGAGGTVYMGYQNSDGTARIAVSHDKGKTWLYDQNVGAGLGIKNSVFPAVTAGDDNRAAFAFLGTTTGGNYQDSANFKGVWHLYVATTYDGGQSWVTVDATPTDPVQKGSICTGGTTCGNDRNLLDFNDITLDAQGRVLAAYADGCTGTCATGGAQNFDALASIARQSSGSTLYGAFDAVAGAKYKKSRGGQ
ncbi:exo-alpha-sialidase [Streptomyces antnestii]|uniref:Exo-alpha-sialidase n=1 Tax=Streptomyces antnestii TaxID=2494256 RepID=A0A437PIT7_9ACTN|nr:sialidase family protein [Streptomyces sp. San01]RVU22220.1 exo-alpha-sialidase [Streptomyces sp. San01]